MPRMDPTPYENRTTHGPKEGTSIVRHRTAPFGTVRHRMAPYETVKYRKIPYSTAKNRTEIRTERRTIVTKGPCTAVLCSRCC